ncbi:MAG: hypothetical protein ACOC7U_06780 [Spirochaetota bacterium]
MQIGIMYSTDKEEVGRLAQGLKKGLEEQGMGVKVFPDNAQNFAGVASCKNIFVGTYKTSIFRPRTPAGLKNALKKAGAISGKRSIAFVAKGGMGERKALLSLMNDMEKQGCYLIDQVSFSSEQEAYEFGKNIDLK